MNDSPTDDISSRLRAREAAGLEAAVGLATGQHDLGYAARDFVVCGLPFRRPRGGELSYRRQNGDTLLEITGHADHGLPHGQDRLIPIWLATAFFAAGRPLDNVIRFRCVTDILRAFGLSTAGGRDLERLRERILRVFYATYLVAQKGQQVVDGHVRRFEHKKRHQLMRSIELDMLEVHRRPQNQYTLWQDRIELDGHFADELREGGRIPIDLATVIALKESSPALDLYVWQAWRSYRLLRNAQAPTKIPVFGPGGLVAQLGTETKAPTKIRQNLREWQALVRRVWPACPNALDEACEYFHLEAGAAITVGINELPVLPGVSTRPPPMRRTTSGHTLSLFRDDVDDVATG